MDRTGHSLPWRPVTLCIHWTTRDWRPFPQVEEHWKRKGTETWSKQSSFQIIHTPTAEKSLPELQCAANWQLITVLRTQNQGNCLSQGPFKQLMSTVVFLSRLSPSTLIIPVDVHEVQAGRDAIPSIRHK